MNDDLYGSEGPSSCAESFPSETEEPEYKPPPPIIVQPKCLEEIMEKCLSRDLKNEFEIFEMASKQGCSYLKSKRESRNPDELIRGLNRKECHSIDLGTRVCHSRTLGEIVLSDTTTSTVFLVSEMTTFELKCFLRS